MGGIKAIMVVGYLNVVVNASDNIIWHTPLVSMQLPSVLTGQRLSLVVMIKLFTSGMLFLENC